MSDEPAEADETERFGLLRSAYRTVTPEYRPRLDPEMDTIGWTMFLIIVVLFVPLLPFIVIVWLISRVLGAIVPRRGGQRDQ